MMLKAVAQSDPKALAGNDPNQRVIEPSPDQVGKELGEDSEVFLRLMVAQLRQQNPLNPLKNAEMMQQLAAFNQVEQLINLNENFTRLLGNRELIEANGLVGRFVEGVDANGNLIRGVVTRVERVDGVVTLKVGDQLLLLSQVTTVALNESGSAMGEAESSGDKSTAPFDDGGSQG